MRFVFTQLLATFAVLSNATKTEDYPEFAEFLDNGGYDWEPHQVKTEDGWYLTLFRIKPDKEVVAATKPKLPLYLLHGSMDSAAGFLLRSDQTWALQMVDKGYDIWVNNSRGVKYSDKNERDGEWSLKERWDFNWADMGYYDVPAGIDYIISETGAKQVTVAAHSQGSSQMWYALSHRQDYFAEKINRFVSLASCVIPEVYPGVPTDYKGLVSLFLRAEELGIYNVNGADDSSMPVGDMFCLVLENPLICFANEVVKWSGFATSAGAQSMGSFFYYAQTLIENRFQEPLSLQAYASGQRISPLVPLQNIDRVPVNMMHAIGDSRCPMVFAEHLYMRIPTAEKSMFVKNIRHFSFASLDQAEYVDQLEEIIETGRVTKEYTGGQASLLTFLYVSLITAYLF